MLFFAQMQLPLSDLPEGPSLDAVRGPIDIPALEPWQFWTLIGLACVAAGIIVWLLIRYLWNRGTRETSVPPRDAALATLALAGTCEDDTEFAVIVSQALRGYYKEAIGIRALEQTTAEFIAVARQHPDVPEDESEALEQILTLCDRVKFARAKLPETERSQLTASAVRWIEAHHQRTCPEITEAPPALRE